MHKRMIVNQVKLGLGVDISKWNPKLGFCFTKKPRMNPQHHAQIQEPKVPPIRVLVDWATLSYWEILVSTRHKQQYFESKIPVLLYWTNAYANDMTDHEDSHMIRVNDLGEHCERVWWILEYDNCPYLIFPDLNVWIVTTSEHFR